MKDSYEPQGGRRVSSVAKFTVSFLVFFTVLSLIFWRQVVTQISFISSTIHTQSKVLACPSQHTKGTVFTEHWEYQTMNGTGDRLWEGLVTPNGGFLVIPDDDGVEQLYGVSMFHQLHCLAMIRNDFKILMGMAGVRSLNSTEVMTHMSKRDGGHHHGKFDERHLLHCLDYLRQVFLCYADNTLEKTMPAEGDGHPKVNGMVEHFCPGRPDILYSESKKAVTFRGKGGSVKKEP